MTDNSTLPPAGWYPAPDGSQGSWWWDGSQWTQPGATTQTSAPRPAFDGAIPKLAAVTQALLIACGALAAVIIGIEVLGFTAVTNVLDGDMSSVDLLNVYGSISPVVTLLSSASLIATGILWVIWQHKAARQVAGLTRRSPAWHAGSWFIPVVAWWFPYQNISDLWKAIGRARPSWLILWWLLWLASNAVIQISARIYLAADDPEQYRSAMAASIVGELLSLAAVPFAWLIVRGITRGLEERAALPQQSPETATPERPTESTPSEA